MLGGYLATDKDEQGRDYLSATPETNGELCDLDPGLPECLKALLKTGLSIDFK